MLKHVFISIFCISGLAQAVVDLYGGIYDPEIQQAIAWNFCDDDYFQDVGLFTPWNDNNRYGVDMSNIDCEALSSTWELYDRNLEYSDDSRQLAKLGDVQANNPYFALYNKYTGVLRVFLWLTPFDIDDGWATTIQADITTDPGAPTFPNHLMDFHEETFIWSQNDVAPKTNKAWMFGTTEPNKWYVMDLFLNYDPTNYHNSDGTEKQLSLRFSVYTLNQSLFSISGNYTAATTKTISNGNYSSFIPGATQQLGMMFPDIGDLGSSTLEGLRLGDFDNWLDDDSKASLLDASIDWSSGNIVSGAMKAISVIPKFFSASGTTEIVHIPGAIVLNGNLETITKPSTTMIPYSGSVNTRAPIYAYAHPDPSARKLGLFNLQDYPTKAYLEQIACYLQINPNSPVEISETKTDYYGIVKYLDPNSPIWKTDTTQQISVISFQDPANRSDSQRQLTLSIRVPRSQLRNKSKLFFDPAETFACKTGYPAVPIDIQSINKQYSVYASTQLKINDNVRIHRTENGTQLWGKAGNGNASESDFTELGRGAIVGDLAVKNGSLFMRDYSSIKYTLSGNPSYISFQNQATTFIGSPLLPYPSPTTLPIPKLAVKLSPYNQVLSEKPDLEISGGGCNYNPKSFNQTAPTCIKVQNSNVATIEPGYYGTINVRGGTTLRFKPGTYWISKLITESGSIITADNATNSTYIYITCELMWKANPVNVNPARFLLVNFADTYGVNLETNFKGTFVDRSMKTTMGQVGKEYQGQFIGNRIEVHQFSTVFYQEFLP